MVPAQDLKINGAKQPICENKSIISLMSHNKIQCCICTSLHLKLYAPHKVNES